MIDKLKQAKKIILELITISKEDELYTRLKKCKKIPAACWYFDIFNKISGGGRWIRTTEG
jgi:ribosomal protein L17